MSESEDSSDVSSILLEVLSTGLWAMGLVSVASATYLVIEEQGLSWLALGPTAMLLVLGVSGYVAVRSMDRISNEVLADAE